jgi:hypothetical protein
VREEERGKGEKEGRGKEGKEEKGRGRRKGEGRKTHIYKTEHFSSIIQSYL